MLSPKLIITSRKNRARELQEQSGTLFAEVLTLEHFIRWLFERHAPYRLMGTLEQTESLRSIIAKGSYGHFGYLIRCHESLNNLHYFFEKCALNDVTIADFKYPQPKSTELEAIHAAYSEYKENNSVSDWGDVCLWVLDYLEQAKEWKKTWSEIVLDDFTADIPLIESKTERSILVILQKQADSMLKRECSSKAKLLRPDIQPFDLHDEMRVAIRTARKLMEDGIRDTDILVVASSIDAYEPRFEMALREYGMQGYSQRGLPLRRYLELEKKVSAGKANNPKDPDLQRALIRIRELKRNLQQEESLLEHLGIHLASENRKKHLEEALKGAYIQPTTHSGIALTEPNQIAGLERRYAYILFVGTDISHFPPKSSDNYLFTQRDNERLFGTPNTYQTSAWHYKELKRLSDHLVLITASHAGKTRLSPSPILEEPKGVLKISSVQSTLDCLKTGLMPEQPPLREYLNALTTPERSVYDGEGIGSFEEYGQKLSASALSSYAKCPLQYYFNTILKLDAPRDSREGFEASDMGSIMHEAFEFFAKKVREKWETTGSPVMTEANFTMLKSWMIDIAKERYRLYLKKEEIEEHARHRFGLSQLMRGLEKEVQEKGLLLKFIDYGIKQNDTLEDFLHSSFEEKFFLDENLQPTDDESKRFIKGFIDRLDLFEDHAEVVDYKSKNLNQKVDKDKLKEIEDFKDFQQGLYIYLVKHKYAKEKIRSKLLTFKSSYEYVEFGKMAYGVDEKDAVIYDKTYEENLKSEIYRIRDAIASGKFGFENGDEQYCGWCDFKMICHQGDLGWKAQICVRVA